MEKIRNFVENMFLGLPDTQDVRDAKAHLLEGMTDRYEALLAQGKGPDEAFGIAVGEFGSMEELRRELGGSFAAAPAGSQPPAFRDEGTWREYEAFRRQYPVAIAVGVVICILAAVFWMILDNWPGGTALKGLDNVVFLCMIALGVFIFVYFGIKRNRFDQELFPEVPRGDDEDPLSGAIMLGATCVYLFIGFTMDLWHPGWIVFPMGGAICMLTKVFFPRGRR